MEVTAGPDIEQDLRDAVQAVLDRHLAKLGLERAEISLTEDHDGDPILLIEAFFSERNTLPTFDTRRLSSTKPGEDPVLLTNRELARAVLSRRHGVFPHLRLRIPDPEPARRRKA